MRKFRLPSPAMTVACISLAVALSGASYAAITLPKNSVGTKQIRNNAVKSNKIAPEQVTGADVNEATLGTVPSAANAANAANAAAIADNTVNAAKVVDNSLGAADINEGNLAAVPQAGNAGTVDGLDMAVLEFTGEAALAAPTEIYNAGGLVLRAQCDLLGNVHLTADSGVDNTLFRYATNAGSGGDPEFDIAEAPIDLLAAGGDGVQGTFTYSRPGGILIINPGATITGVFAAEQDTFSGGGSDCAVRGIVNAYTPSGLVIGPIVPIGG